MGNVFHQISLFRVGGGCPGISPSSVACVNFRESQCESLELSFSGGKMRTAAQGDGTSDNSEKLLQRGRGEGEASMYVTLVKGECMQSSMYFFLKVSASHKEQSSL